MNQYKIVLLSGDGIGPEITEATKGVLNAISNIHSFKLIYEGELEKQQ